MATYLVKHGGQIITNLYYGPHETPEVGDKLTLTVAPQEADVLNNTAPKAGRAQAFKIVSVGLAPSSLDGGNEPEPTIQVEPV